MSEIGNDSRQQCVELSGIRLRETFDEIRRALKARNPLYAAAGMGHGKLVRLRIPESNQAPTSSFWGDFPIYVRFRDPNATVFRAFRINSKKIIAFPIS